MKRFIKAWNLLIVILVPVVTICLSANIVTRMPDVYQYTFKSTEQLESANLTVQSDELGDMISAFMIGKSVDFKVLQGNNADESADFLQAEDMRILKNLRFWLNLLLVLGIAGLIVLISVFVVSKDVEEGDIVNRAIKRAIVSSAITFLMMFICWVINLLSGFAVWKNLLIYMGGSENLKMVITLSLLKYLYVAWSVVTGVLAVIVLYAASKFTEPKRMFSRGNY